MINRDKTELLKNSLYYIYPACVIAIYLTGRIVLEMFTTNISYTMLWCFGLGLLPIVLYIVIKITRSQDHKWYAYLSNFVLIYGVLMYSGYVSWMKSDLILSAVFKPVIVETVPIVSVNKVYSRKLGFQRTDVTILYKNENIKLETRRNVYYLLEHKKALTVTIGRSYTGNYFVTDLHLPATERWSARWTYLKDWASRIWWIPAFFISVFIGIWLLDKYRPKTSDIKPKPIGWKKALIIWMGSMFAIALLAYIGLIIYIKFISI